MNLLYEPPELPVTAWSAVLAPAAEVNLDRWLTDQLDAAGSSPRKVSARSIETARGWPLELATYVVDGRVLIIAVYQFIDVTAAIAIGGLELAWVKAHDLEVAAALRAVEVDWLSPEPLTLRELWAEPLS